MKWFLSVCFLAFAAAILPTEGYITDDVMDWYKDMQDESPDEIKYDGPGKIEETFEGDPMVSEEDAKGNASASCNCVAECSQLHENRLPPDVQVSWARGMSNIVFLIPNI